ncbi:MAG: hypothetical protein ACI9E1_001960 [Cryomorphaceae bacterium]|jgi:hypothetical protein
MKFNTPSVTHSKPDSFYKMQIKWFGQPFDGTEQISLNVAQLQQIHDEAHESGRLRERGINQSGLHSGSVSNAKFY